MEHEIEEKRGMYEGGKFSNSSHPPLPDCVYRIRNTDQFGCKHCKIKGDKWFMKDHNCLGGNGNGKAKQGGK